MRTGKSVSNIAYHRPEIWRPIVDGLRQAGVIGPMLWIPHQGEGGDKPHIHFVLIGGHKTYNTDGMAGLFGFDLIDGQKASVTGLWRTTKSLSDWLLYASHDTRYLAFKGEEKEVEYGLDAIQCTAGDDDTLRALRIEAEHDLSMMGDRTTRRLLLLLRQGKTWREVIVSGLVPMGQMGNAYRTWEYLGGEV